MPTEPDILDVRILIVDELEFSWSEKRPCWACSMARWWDWWRRWACMWWPAPSTQHIPSAPMLGVVVFLAMMGSCVVSGICGAFVPLILRHFGADPVTASSIFLTTAIDVVSMGMLLGLASLPVK